MNRIHIAGGSVLIAASLCLSAACSLEKHAVSHPTPQPTVVAKLNPAPTPVVNQAPAQAFAQIPAQTPVPPPPQTTEENMPRVTGQEAIELVKAGKAIILDVRPLISYQGEHTKGALSLPLNQIEQGDYKAMREDGTYQELPRDKRIISYCT